MGNCNCCSDTTPLESNMICRPSTSAVDYEPIKLEPDCEDGKYQKFC